MKPIDDAELEKIEKRLRAALKSKQPLKQLNYSTVVDLLAIVQEERVRRETEARGGKPAGKKHELTLEESVGADDKG